MYIYIYMRLLYIYIYTYTGTPLLLNISIFCQFFNKYWSIQKKKFKNKQIMPSVISYGKMPISNIFMCLKSI